MAKNYIQYAKGIKDGSVLGKLKNHLKEYWITSPTDCVEFKLDIIGEETLTAENDVTDHFVESNISYQDQVAIKPKIYTIQGEVGELVWYQKDSASQIYGQVAQRLEGVISFLPVRSRSFNQMKDKVMKAAQWVDTADNLISKFSNIKSEITYMLGADGNESEKERTLSKQEAAYLTLLGYRDDRLRPLNIKTPWGVLENYIMTSLKITQPKETRDKSYISMTFKELRLSSVSTVRFDQTKYQGAAGLENQPLVDKGSTPGMEAGISKQVTPDDKENPFYVDGPVGGSNRNEYVANVTDGTEKYKVFYDARRKGELIVTQDGKTIIDSATKDKVASASFVAIKEEINRRGAEDLKRIKESYQ